MTAEASVPSARLNLTHALFATCFGNALEWFDVAVYSFFSSYIAQNFFPNKNPALSLIITFGTFAIAFLIRPIGAIVLGAFADTHGRKSALVISMGLMTLSLLIMAITPSFAHIGIWAPVIIITARLIQGFSAGGEYGSSTALLVEMFPEKRKYIASWQFSTQGMSTLMAAAFGFILTAVMTNESLTSWGWRIPFIFGLLIGPVGIYIRRSLKEPDRNSYQQKSETKPLTHLFKHSKLLVLIGGGMLAISTAINYLLQYMPAYAKNSLHLSSHSGYAGTLIAGGILAVITPISGWLAERMGRPVLIITSLALFVLTIIPSFLLLNHYPSTMMLISILGWLALLKAVYFSTVPSLMADLFQTEVRASGMSIAYNLSVTIFGGFTPLISSSLVTVSGSSVSPAFYLMGLAILSALCVFGFYKKAPSENR